MDQFSYPRVQDRIKRRQQPATTAREAAARRLEDNGIDPNRLRETFNRFRDGEQNLSNMARRAALLRTQGRRTEADAIVNNIRLQRENPAYGANRREASKIRRLLTGTVGDLPPEQQRLNAVRNQRSMQDSVRSAAQLAQQDATSQADAIRAKKVMLGRRAWEREYGTTRPAPTDEQAARFFDVIPANEQADFTRGVPLGDAGPAQRRANELAAQAQQEVPTSAVREPRAIDPMLLARIRRAQEQEIRAEGVAASERDTAMTIEELRQRQALADAQAAAGVAEVGANRAPEIAGAQADEVLSGVQAGTAKNRRDMTQYDAEGNEIPDVFNVRKKRMQIEQQALDREIASEPDQGSTPVQAPSPEQIGTETAEQYNQLTFDVPRNLSELRMQSASDGLIVNLENVERLISAAINNSPDGGQAYARYVLGEMSRRGGTRSGIGDSGLTNIMQFLGGLKRPGAFGHWWSEWKDNKSEKAYKAIDTYTRIVNKLEQVANIQ